MVVQRLKPTSLFGFIHLRMRDADGIFIGPGRVNTGKLGFTEQSSEIQLKEMAGEGCDFGRTKPSEAGDAATIMGTDASRLQCRSATQPQSHYTYEARWAARPRCRCHLVDRALSRSPDALLVLSGQ
jgi:hypothetical protein